MPSQSTIPIVICERDEPSMRQLVAALPNLGSQFETALARNPRELQATLVKVKPLLVICSQNIPDLVIQEVYSQVTQHAPKAKIISIAAEMRPGVLTEAIKNGARDVITRDNLAQLAVVVARELDMLDEYRIHLHSPPSAEGAADIEPDHVYLDDGIVVGCGVAVARLIGANDIDGLIGTLILDYCDAAYLSDIRERMKQWAHGDAADQPLEIPGITIDGKKLPLKVCLVAIDQANLGQLVLSIERGDKARQAEPGDATENTVPQSPPSEKPTADAARGSSVPASPDSPASPASPTAPPSGPAARPAPQAQKAAPVATAAILKPDDNPWIGKLTHALKHDEFALASQRITALTPDEKVITEDGTEHIDILIRMFLRLKDAGKEINARTFMDSARTAGLLPEIDRWVIGHACDLLAQHYGQDRHPRFFLRISPESMARKELLPWIASRLKESGAPAGSLSFEMPEAEIIEHLDDTLPTLKKLREMGCHITISHYGSTSKSDMLLDSMPVHYVKLHPNDVRSIAENEHAVERIAKVTERMHHRKVATIAPQVERAAQLAALWQCGVDYAQGYYMKQPEIVLTSAYKQKEEAEA